MLIFEEVEKIIAELPAEQATSLKIWLNEFQAAHGYRQIKAYTLAIKTLADFQKADGNAMYN